MQQHMKLERLIKRNVEHTLAQHIKSDKSFNAHVRSRMFGIKLDPWRTTLGIKLHMDS